MTEKLDIVDRLRVGQSIRAIQRETGVHRTIVRRVRDLATEAGWLSSDRQPPDQGEVARLLATARSTSREATHPLDAFATDISRWLEEGNTFLVIHQLISETYACSEATVRRYVQKHYPQARRLTMVRPTVAGEILEVDFGYLGITYDPQERRNRTTYLFSARCRHSRKAYRERVFRQDQHAFFSGHIHAFEYFGGVPQKVVPDNLKAAVIVASFKDPLVNRAYHELSRHYGFLICPCEPYRPRLKGGVESDVKYVKRNFWPVFREHQRRLGRQIPDGEELVEALRRWSVEVADEHMIHGVGRSPQEIFESEERPALKTLPPQRWDCVVCAQAKVQETWRIQFDSAFYSVPYRHVGRTVQILANATSVRIFFDYHQIAMHRRARRKWEYLQNAEHAPANVAAYLAENDQAILVRARSIGAAVEQLASQILSRTGVDGLRPARALLALKGRYGAQRLQHACERALAFEQAEFRSVKAILAKGLDLEDPRDVIPQTSDGQGLFRFARRPGYFDPSYVEEESYE